MKKQTTIFIISILFTTAIAAQQDFPSFEKIVTTFFSSYDLRIDQSDDDLRFVKQQNGYSIEEYDNDKNEYYQKVLFWSSAKKGYLKLDFPANKNPDTEQIDYHLGYYNIEVFNTLPFYGYVNWPNEVITFLEAKSELSDVEIYALGRAYGTRAAHLLNNSFEFSNAEEQFDLKESGKNQLSPDQLKSYLALIKESTKNYEKLCARNPSYPTLVGTICNKLHNEYLSAFLNISIYQNESEALKLLPEILYSDFYIDNAKNYLNSLEPNAILLTTGDNDTFPLLYVQAKSNHRRDVLVLNTSLLNQNSYVNHLRNDTVFDSSSIAMRLTPKTYTKEKLDVIVLEKDSISKEFVELNSFLNKINVNDSSTVFKPFPAYSKLPSNRIAITIKDTKALKLNYKAQYIQQWELIALDIVASNINERPIYCSYNELPIVSKYLEQSGFAVKIVANPKNKVEGYLYVAGIDADKTYDVLVNNFKFHKKTEDDLKTKLSVLLSYATSFNLLARYYQSSGDIEKCEEVITAFLNFYPHENYLHSSSIILELAQSAYLSSLSTKGDELSDKLLRNIENEQKIKKNPNKEELEDYMYVVFELKQLKIENIGLQKRMTSLENYFISEYAKN